MKLSAERQFKDEMEREELTFVPNIVAKEIRGVNSVVDSFNKRVNARPKAEIIFGNTIYTRCKRDLSFKKLQSEPPQKKNTAQILKKKNSIAIKDFYKRQK